MFGDVVEGLFGETDPNILSDIHMFNDTFVDMYKGGQVRHTLMSLNQFMIQRYGFGCDSNEEYDAAMSKIDLEGMRTAPIDIRKVIARKLI